MINPRNKFSSRSSLLVSASMTALVVASLVGCSDPAPPPPPPMVVVPPPPPPPSLTPISELMARYNIDPRVVLPEDRAPNTDPQRIAVLQFFDAFVRGNVSALTPMLSPPDQYQLEQLALNNAFEELAKSISKCDVRCGSHESDDCTLAVFSIGEEFQPQLWVYTVSESSSEFDSIATPLKVLDKLSGSDWIAAWYKILSDELALAQKPDEVVEAPSQDLSQEADPASAAPEAAPGLPGAMPSGKRTPGAPIGAPKPPGFGTK
ncbi:MAG: hypothetical protein EXS10_05350 [Phycisphaerales bacterium]|nr:hypothetical protein [Phycisphaerales bacterium]